jgi:capsular polysaccharide biosynthesis protein
VQVLRSHDFEIVRIDPARPWEQVQASRGAEIMVGVHGAALSNLIFMSPGARVIELRRPERDGVFFFDAYHPLADAVGVEYCAQFCEPAHQATGYEINNADLVVDLDLLRENLG